MNTLGETLSLMKRQRETIAATIFNQDYISHLITGAALKGMQYCRVQQNVEIDLSETEAAKRLVLDLKEHGYDCGWEETIKKGDVTRPHSAYTYQELEIYWHDKESLEYVSN